MTGLLENRRLGNHNYINFFTLATNNPIDSSVLWVIVYDWGQVERIGAAKNQPEKCIKEVRPKLFINISEILLKHISMY